MPIYAYRCEACGFAKDVLQKLSDAPLTDCLACGQPTFKKQLTAAGFQLKGSGWYVTDFRGGDGKTSAPAPDTSAATSPAADKPVTASNSKPATESKTATPASSSPDSSGKTSTS